MLIFVYLTSVYVEFLVGIKDEVLWSWIFLSNSYFEMDGSFYVLLIGIKYHECFAQCETNHAIQVFMQNTIHGAWQERNLKIEPDS